MYRPEQLRKKNTPPEAETAIDMSKLRKIVEKAEQALSIVPDSIDGLRKTDKKITKAPIDSAEKARLEQERIKKMEEYHEAMRLAREQRNRLKEEKGGKDNNQERQREPKIAQIKLSEKENETRLEILKLLNGKNGSVHQRKKGLRDSEE